MACGRSSWMRWPLPRTTCRSPRVDALASDCCRGSHTCRCARSRAARSGSSRSAGSTGRPVSCDSTSNGRSPSGLSAGASTSASTKPCNSACRPAQACEVFIVATIAGTASGAGRGPVAGSGGDPSAVAAITSSRRTTPSGCSHVHTSRMRRVPSSIAAAGRCRSCCSCEESTSTMPMTCCGNCAWYSRTNTPPADMPSST